VVFHHVGDSTALGVLERGRESSPISTVDSGYEVALQAKILRVGYEDL
jgi:hypothetical protein